MQSFPSICWWTFRPIHYFCYRKCSPNKKYSCLANFLIDCLICLHIVTLQLVPLYYVKWIYTNEKQMSNTHRNQDIVGKLKMKFLFVWHSNKVTNYYCYKYHMLRQNNNKADVTGLYTKQQPHTCTGIENSLKGNRLSTWKWGMSWEGLEGGS